MSKVQMLFVFVLQGAVQLGDFCSPSSASIGNHYRLQEEPVAGKTNPLN